MNGREDRIIFMKKKNIVFVLCLIFALGFLFVPQEGRNAEAASRTRLSSISLKIVPGKTEKLRIYGRRGRKVVWTSSRPRVVSVENGKLTAFKRAVHQRSQRGWGLRNFIVKYGLSD